MASGNAPLLAVMVNVKVPAAAGVPLSSPVELRVRPVGKDPVAANVGAGNPVAVT